MLAPDSLHSRRGTSARWNRSELILSSTRAAHVVSLDSVKEHVLAGQSYAVNLARATSHAAKRKTGSPLLSNALFIVCSQRLSYSTRSSVSFSCYCGGLIRHRLRCKLNVDSRIGSALAVQKAIFFRTSRAYFAASSARRRGGRGRTLLPSSRFRLERDWECGRRRWEGSRSRGPSTIT